MTVIKGSKLPPPINIRFATPADLPVIEDILRSTVQTPYGSGNINEDDEEEI